MKIFTTSQIRRADAHTIEREPVTALKLMERAAEAGAKWLVNHITEKAVFQIFCGPGNNGGDGLALARLLDHEGFQVNVFAETASTETTEGFQINLQRLAEHPEIAVHPLKDISLFQFDQNSVIIDALFGSGLNRPIEGEWVELILFFNTLRYRKIAVDIPSGLYADGITAVAAPVFQVNDTLSFQFWKHAFLHPETGRYCGNIHILSIGLHSEFIKDEPSEHFIVDEDLIRAIYKPRKPFSHKGDFGKSRIVGGSLGMMGAVVLATKAAVTAGSGITHVSAPSCGYGTLQTSCPEAMFSTNGTEYAVEFSFETDETLGIGPGLGTYPETQEAFLKFLKGWDQPLVLDADALNILAQNPDYLSLIRPGTIITPHPKEFERLFGASENSFDQLTLARKNAQKLKICIVLKDHHTQIITPEGKVFYNITGNSGMAKGGSGDVLLGIITSLRAQHYSPENAAVFGVWLHGKAGDLAALKYSKEAMLPSDLIAELGNIFLELSDKHLHI